MPNGAARAAPSDNTKATRNTTTPPTPLSRRVVKGIPSTTTSSGEALSAELNIRARLKNEVRPDGSRLRCGRRVRGRKSAGSFQALVRQRPSRSRVHQRGEGAGGRYRRRT